MTWGQTLRNKMSKSREELARVEFTTKAILEACGKRAAEGYSWCEIRPSRPISVEKTKAVNEMLLELGGDQLRFEWEPFRERPDLPAYSVLKVSWEKQG
jgi:hypothetical protein